MVKLKPVEQCSFCGWNLVKAIVKGDRTISGCLACEEELLAFVDQSGSLKGRYKSKRKGHKTLVDPKLTFDRF